LRSVGFYVSPGISDHFFAGVKMKAEPKYSSSFGYRFINKLKHGFFLEGGCGFIIFNGKYHEESRTWYYHGYTPYYYTEQRNIKEYNWMAPFMAGYMSPKGKVRFQGALGIAFNLKNCTTEEIKIIEGDAPSYFYTGNNQKDTYPDFGTSFLAIARAGISIPVGQRINIEILPTARYCMFYFTSERFDLIQSIDNIERPWSLGIDISVTYALNNLKREEVYEKPYDNNNPSYTMEVGDSSVRTKKLKLLNNGPKNAVYFEFGGNGLLYSMNYERTVFRKGIVNIQARAGMGIVGDKCIFPLGANIALGTGRKKFEAGLTCSLGNYNLNEDNRIDSYYSRNNAFNCTIDPSLAFRVESKKHFFLRLAVMTHYFPVTGGLIPGVGVSLGGCF